MSCMFSCSFPAEPALLKLSGQAALLGQVSLGVPDRQGKGPHSQGCHPMVPKQEEQSRSGEATRFCCSPEVMR